MNVLSIAAHYGRSLTLWITILILYACLTAHVADATALGSLGDTCLNSSDCSSDNCISGACNAHTCNKAKDCTSHLCSFGVCQPGAAGATCNVRSDCISTVCKSSNCLQSHVGFSCYADTDCVANTTCWLGKCLSVSGVSCQTPTDCLSADCTASKCAPGAVNVACNSSADCFSSVCHKGTCASAPVNGMCNSDSDCTNRHCVSGRCLQGATTAPCAVSSDCISGNCVAGTCGLSAAGMKCYTSDDCANGSAARSTCFFINGNSRCLLFANSPCGTNSSLCLSGTCNGTVSKNGKCQLAGPGAPCLTTSDCAQGLNCPAAMNICLASLRQPCTPGSNYAGACAPGLICLATSTTNSTLGECYGLLGYNCKRNSDCATNFCGTESHVCTSTSNRYPCYNSPSCLSGVCLGIAYAGHVSPGSCSLGAAGVDCLANGDCIGSVCDIVTNTCRKSDPGAGCFTNADCGRGSCYPLNGTMKCLLDLSQTCSNSLPTCLSQNCTAGTCQPSHVLNAPCNASSDCSGALNCSLPTVTCLLSAGQACNNSHFCFTGRCATGICVSQAGASCTAKSGGCLSGTCSASRCAPAYAGGACLAASDCYSGLCANGTCAPGPAGGVCAQAADCVSLACSTTKKCAKSQAGQNCTTQGDCVTGTCFAVSSSVNTCLLSKGAACNLSAQCLSNTCSQGSHCASGGYLAPCGNASDCAPGTRCLNNSCSTQIGDTCTNNTCVHGSCVNSTCQLQGFWSNCTTTADCEDGLSCGYDISHVPVCVRGIGQPCGSSHDCAIQTSLTECFGGICIYYQFGSQFNYTLGAA